MVRELDCRGLACPAPVLQTKQLLEKENLAAIKIIVDNEAARQNVTRFLEHQKFQVTVEKLGSDLHLLGTKAGEVRVVEKPAPKAMRSARPATQSVYPAPATGPARTTAERRARRGRG